MVFKFSYILRMFSFSVNKRSLYLGCCWDLYEVYGLYADYDSLSLILWSSVSANLKVVCWFLANFWLIPVPNMSIMRSLEGSLVTEEIDRLDDFLERVGLFLIGCCFSIFLIGCCFSTFNVCCLSTFNVCCFYTFNGYCFSTFKDGRVSILLSAGVNKTSLE